MASGSSSRANNPGSKGFDFASDDILCSYDDFGNQDKANGNHSDPVIGSSSAKEFQKNRMTRSSVFPTPAYSPPEDSSADQDVAVVVEKTVKKYTDNLMRFLEGISSRLSQLELYCYNLEKSIGEMRSELVQDNVQADSKLKSLEKNLQEVHRSVQILRDKQELVETQKELAKLQLAQKESSGINPQDNEERPKQPASEVQEKQLALALPHQLTPQQASLTTRPMEQQQPPPVQAPLPGNSQSAGYYLPQPQLSQSQYMPSDFTRLPPQPVQPQLNQAPQVQTAPPYQQQWGPQLPQPQQQARPSSPAVYPTYLPSQSSPAQEIPSTVSMQVSFPGITQSGVASRPEGVPYGYGVQGRPPAQQQAPAQHMRPVYDGYGVSGPHPSPGNAYTMYDGDGARSQQPHFPHGGYPRPPQQMRNHPYNELIEKMVSMGYRGDHVNAAIQRLEESGQPVDFNTILDRLNGHSSASPQRGW